VVAGALAEQFLASYGVSIIAWVSSIGTIRMPDSFRVKDRTEVDQSIVRCPEKQTSEKMIDLIRQVKEEKDSVGGIITCVIQNVPAGIGEPVFDKLNAELGKAMLSINAVHGFEFGSGFEGSTMRGSAHNDVFYQSENGQTKTRTNFSGGIQGGISNGMDIICRVAFKPPSTIGQKQETINVSGQPAVMQPNGRHDPCVVPRAVPIVESMAALTISDLILRQHTPKK
jgi:chorismate synthase